MPFRAAIVACCFALVSCAELAPTSDGGTGGTNGSGGTGGAGGTGGIDSCSVVIPAAAEGTEDDDSVIVPQGIVSAFLCSGACDDDQDLSDRWSITTCGGDYTIRLTWNNNLDDDLDLALFDSRNDLVERADTRTALGTLQVELTEELTESLTAEEPYVVEVTAVNTSGNVRNYRLVVVPAD